MPFIPDKPDTGGFTPTGGAGFTPDAPPVPPGQKLKRDQLASLIRQAGGTEEEARKLSYIGYEESAGDQSRTNKYTEDGKVHYVSSIWQISDVHGDPKDWNTAQSAAKKALEIFRAEGLTPWESSRKTGATGGWGQYFDTSEADFRNKSSQQGSQAPSRETSFTPAQQRLPPDVQPGGTLEPGGIPKTLKGVSPLDHMFNTMDIFPFGLADALVRDGKPYTNFPSAQKFLEKIKAGKVDEEMQRYNLFSPEQLRDEAMHGDPLAEFFLKHPLWAGIGQGVAENANLAQYAAGGVAGKAGELGLQAAMRSPIGRAAMNAFSPFVKIAAAAGTEGKRAVQALATKVANAPAEAQAKSLEIFRGLSKIEQEAVVHIWQGGSPSDYSTALTGARSRQELEKLQIEPARLAELSRRATVLGEYITDVLKRKAKLGITDVGENVARFFPTHGLTTTPEKELLESTAGSGLGHGFAHNPEEPGKTLADFAKSQLDPKASFSVVLEKWAASSLRRTDLNEALERAPRSLLIPLEKVEQETRRRVEQFAKSKGFLSDSGKTIEYREVAAKAGKKGTPGTPGTPDKTVYVAQKGFKRFVGGKSTIDPSKPLSKEQRIALGRQILEERGLVGHTGALEKKVIPGTPGKPGTPSIPGSPARLEQSIRGGELPGRGTGFRTKTVYSKPPEEEIDLSKLPKDGSGETMLPWELVSKKYPELRSVDAPALRNSLISPALADYLAKRSTLLFDDKDLFLPNTTLANKMLNHGLVLFDHMTEWQRRAIVANPIIHPVWNLSNNLHAAGVPFSTIAGLVTKSVISSFGGKALVEKFLPASEAFTKAVEEATAAGAIAELKHGDTRLLASKFSELNTADKVHKAFEELGAWNARGAFGKYGEQAFAATMYKHLMDTGKYVGKSGQDEVAGLVREALGNYQNVNAFEKGVVSRIVFFYPWLKGNTSYWARKLATNPVYIAAPHQAARANNLLVQDPSEYDPKHPAVAKDFQWIGGNKKDGFSRNTPMLPQRILGDVSMLATGDPGTIFKKMIEVVSARLQPIGGVAASVAKTSLLPPQSTLDPRSFDAAFSKNAPRNEQVKELMAHIAGELAPIPILHFAVQQGLQRGISPEEIKQKITAGFWGDFVYDGLTKNQQVQMHNAMTNWNNRVREMSRSVTPEERERRLYKYYRTYQDTVRNILYGGKDKADWWHQPVGWAKRKESKPHPQSTGGEGFNVSP